MYEIIPGILEKDWNEIERKIELVRPFAKTIHIDILDGKFAPNNTFLDPTPFKKYSDQFFFELHMMIENPIEYLKPWADAGIKRFIGHVERMPNQEEFVKFAKRYGEVGLVVDGETSLDEVKISLGDLDCLLFMTINAGFSGQTFNETKLEKVRIVRALQQVQGKLFPIEVDGGINDQTIILAKNSGANRFISTSFLFNSDNPEEQYRKLQQAINF